MSNKFDIITKMLSDIKKVYDSFKLIITGDDNYL